AIDDLLCISTAGVKGLRYLRGHRGAIRGLARLDDRRVVSASDDATLRVWDVETGKSLRRLKGHTLMVDVVARLDQNRVISASLWDNTPRVWDVETGKALRKLKGKIDALA